MHPPSPPPQSYKLLPSSPPPQSHTQALAGAAFFFAASAFFFSIAFCTAGLYFFTPAPVELFPASAAFAAGAGFFAAGAAAGLLAAAAGLGGAAAVFLGPSLAGAFFTGGGFAAAEADADAEDGVDVALAAERVLWVFGSDFVRVFLPVQVMLAREFLCLAFPPSGPTM